MRRMSRRWAWLLVAALIGWSAVCLFLVVIRHDPVEAAVDPWEADAQQVWFLMVAVVWAAVSAALICGLRRTCRSN